MHFIRGISPFRCCVNQVVRYSAEDEMRAPKITWFGFPATGTRKR
jgi:hypothetical protein